MPCYHPLKAYRSRSGDKSTISFKPVPDSTELELPCSQCIGCKLERSRQWAIRCVHEASLYEKNCFITLTYNDENLPADESINVAHFQKFMKRLRHEFPEQKIRYFHCGEYGEQLGRPHYHACLFNFDFEDKTLWKDGENKIYVSDTLNRLWKKGYCTIGNVSFESAAYVARYITKKLTGKIAPDHYKKVTRYGELVEIKPEYITMSRRPGIGAYWLEKYKNEVYPADEVILRNRKMKPPKFYDKLYQDSHPDHFSDIQIDREIDAMKHESNNTPDRLHVRETITKYKHKQHSRSFECS